MHQSVPTAAQPDVSALITQITRDALKRAALAPNYMAALDITGAALMAVAYLAKQGVSHA